MNYQNAQLNEIDKKITSLNSILEDIKSSLSAEKINQKLQDSFNNLSAKLKQEIKEEINKKFTESNNNLKLESDKRFNNIFNDKKQELVDNLYLRVDFDNIFQRNREKITKLSKVNVEKTVKETTKEEIEKNDIQEQFNEFKQNLNSLLDLAKNDSKSFYETQLLSHVNELKKQDLKEALKENLNENKSEVYESLSINLLERSDFKELVNEASAEEFKKEAHKKELKDFIEKGLLSKGEELFNLLQNSKELEKTRFIKNLTLLRVSLSGELIAVSNALRLINELDLIELRTKNLKNGNENLAQYKFKAI